MVAPISARRIPSRQIPESTQIGLLLLFFVVISGKHILIQPGMQGLTIHSNLLTLYW